MTHSLLDSFPEARPFEFPGEGAAALLVHGFTGTAAEMLPLGKAISDKLGWHVKGILLPGHGTNASDMQKSTADDWFAAVQGEAKKLHTKYEKVHLIGLSMGALLCLKATMHADFPVCTLSLLSPAVWMRSFLFKWGLRLLSALPCITWFYPMRKKRNIEEESSVVSYDVYPLRAALELYRLQKDVRALSKFNSPPTFMAYTNADLTIHPKSIPFLAERLENPANQVLHIENSIHVLTLGEKRVDLEEGVIDFLSQNR